MLKRKVHDRTESPLAFPAEDLRVQPARLKDVPEMYRIERASFPSPWSRAYFIHEIRRNPVAHVLVLRDCTNDRIAGYVDAWIIHARLHINNLAVHPGCRNRGWGEILMRKALEVGIEHHCRLAVLEVRISNRVAQRLYLRLGFRVAAELPSYYSNGENAYVLTADLAGTP